MLSDDQLGSDRNPLVSLRCEARWFLNHRIAGVMPLWWRGWPASPPVKASSVRRIENSSEHAGLLGGGSPDQLCGGHSLLGDFRGPLRRWPSQFDVPALNQRFVALRGRGATRNNHFEPGHQCLMRKPSACAWCRHLVSVAMGQTIASVPRSGIWRRLGWCWMNWVVRFAGWMRILRISLQEKTLPTSAFPCWRPVHGLIWRAPKGRYCDSGGLAREPRGERASRSA